MNDYSILFEDDSLIVADKLSPIPVQPEKTGDPSLQALLSDMIAGRDGKAPAFLEAVHRIDRRSSGAVAFAKDRKAAAALSEALRDGEFGKTYLAVVDKAPEPPEGRLEQWIVWDGRRDKAHIVPEEGAEAKKAILSYRVASRSERYVMLEVRLETGRPHQIRAQLSSLGLPVRGDLKYGARRSTKNGLIMLHAWKLSFRHPRTGETVSLEAPPPASDPLWAAFLP